MTTWGLTELPLNIDLESKKVLKVFTFCTCSIGWIEGEASIYSQSEYF